MININVTASIFRFAFPSIFSLSQLITGCVTIIVQWVPLVVQEQHTSQQNKSPHPVSSKALV